MPPVSLGKQVYCTFPGVRAATLLEVTFWRKSSACGPLYPKFAHVRHVEDAHAVADGQMFVDDARIFNRHIISRKLVHLGTQRDMFFSKWSGFHETNI